MNRETRCEVLCSETLICRIWLELCSKLEGNKDHLLSQARSDLASRDLHVESLNKCIKRKSKDWNYRTHNTNLLNLVENKLDCKRSYYEKDKSSSRYAVRSKHEMGKMKRAQEQQVDEFSMQKVRENHETINSSLPNCKKCKNRRILWTILENSRMLNQIIVEGCLTFPVNLRWLRVLVLCSAATKGCRLIHGINLEYKKTFLEINFLRLTHFEIFLKEFHLTTCKEIEKQQLEIQG